MKNLTKTLSLIIAVFMIMTALLTGCGSSTGKENATSTAVATTTAAPTADPNAIDTSKAIDLKIILLGGKPVDLDAVYEKVNARAKTLINATITPTFYDWGDWDKKYNLAFASGEDFDLIYTSNWAFYRDQATKNGFLELKEDMLKKYAPKTWADVTPDQWTQTKIDGKVFMVPYTNKEFGKGIVMLRGDLRKKYNVPEVKTQADLFTYMDAIAKNEKSIFAFNAGGSDTTAMLQVLLFKDPNAAGRINVNGVDLPTYYDMTDTTKLTLINRFDDPKYLDLLKKLQEFKNKGYWSQSALSNKTANETAFDNGTSATYMRGPLNISQAYMKDSSAHPEWDLEIVDVNPGIPVFSNPVTNNGVGVHATSNNPERSLMMLDLLRYDKEINDLTTLGIPGKHWEAVGDDKYKALPDGKNFGPDSASPWGWRTSLFRTDANAPQAVVDVLKVLDQTATVHPLLLFNFDASNLKSEAAAVKTVMDSYDPILSEGFAKDIEKTVQDCKAKLATAGYDRIIAEYTKQANEFLAAYGK